LGLAISKRIVELMSGEIWIESALGQGASFCFTIKAARDETGRPSLLNPEVHWGNLRIFAVDDDPEVRLYFTEKAQGFGIACDVAASAEEALAMLEEGRLCDIYFVDWKMPGMDGITLARQIKARSQGKGNAVVTLMSATEWGVIAEEAKGAGVDRFLAKPLFPSDIVDCINECLGRAVPPTAEATAAMDRFPGKRVLLAEDVEINREIVLALLEPAELEIDCAENGAEAVRMAQQQAYDLIFMDMQMPEMDGLTATRRIRALEGPAAQVPIIAMTANAFREDIEKCLAAGMNGHVGKPLDLDVVLGMLRTYLRDPAGN
jgi:CheY-like chemotaxis protein